VLVLLAGFGTTAACGVSGDPSSLQPAAPPPALPTSIQRVEITEAVAVSETVEVGEELLPLVVGERVSVSAGEKVTMGVDVTVALTAVARDAEGNEVDGVRFRWVSDGEAVSIKRTTGLVTGESPGEASVTVSAEGVDSEAIQFSVTAEGVPSFIELSSTPVNSDARTEIGVFGTATVNARVTDQLGDPVPSVEVDFQVSDSNIGTISPMAQTNAEGVAVATFAAADHGGTAVITATADTINAFTSIEILPANPVGIQFKLAEPSVIGIKGVGQTVTSVITFLVKDTNGNPAADGVKICFALKGPGGGAKIEPTEASTTGFGTPTAGEVRTILQSGTVPGPARIVATYSETDSCPPPDPSVVTESAPVSIGGGVPDLAHFTLSADKVNLASFLGDPRTAALANVQATLSAFIADQFGNFNVLEGTSVSFIIEAGSIDRSNILDAQGATSVIIRTQEPPPIDRGSGTLTNTIFGPDPSANAFVEFTPCVAETGIGCNPEDAFVTVVAMVKGQECFTDVNGNGVFDVATDFDEVTQKICDQGEPFINSNDSTWPLFSGLPGLPQALGGTPQRDPNEIFVDVNENGIWDPPNGVWDGPTGAGGTHTTIWKELKMIFSGRPDQLEVKALTSVDPAFGNVEDPQGWCLDVGEFITFQLTVADSNGDFAILPAPNSPNGHRPMAGSSVALTTTAGMLTPEAAEIPDGSGPFTLQFSVANDFEIIDGASPQPEAASVSIQGSWVVPGFGTTLFSPSLVSGTLVKVGAGAVGSCGDLGISSPSPN